MIEALLASTLDLYLDAAPWLLAGLIAAGLIKGLVSEAAMARWLGGEGFGPILRGALVGAPLPLCSCGVLPAALGVRRAGAGRGPTVSFLVATPETGIDSVAVSYALLGPFLTIVRPIAAILGAVFAGLLAARVPEKPLATQAAPAACCCTAGCAAPAVEDKPAAPSRALNGIRYALTDILDDIAPWLAVGLVAAGAIAAWVPPEALAEWGSGLPAMLLMLVIGIPMYICATASTPVAAALLLAGVSPGTVLVFLLAGPATNIATLAVVRRELGGAVLAAYLAGVAIAAIGFGLLTDWTATTLGIEPAAQIAASAELLPAWLAWGSALLLALLAVRPLRRVVAGFG